MNDLIVKLREFVKSKGADALLINSTNKFLTEYNQLDKNSRYKVTGFSGSTGDALLTLNNLYQFVDGRYYEQADEEVNSETTVIKVPLGNSYMDSLIELVGTDNKLLVVSPKISLAIYKLLSKKLNEVSSEIIRLDTDPVEEILGKPAENSQKVFAISTEIAGVSAKDKIISLQYNFEDNEVAIITALEDVAYFTNLRSFDIPFSSTFYSRMIITKNSSCLYTDAIIDQACFFAVKKLGDFPSDLSEIKNSQVIVDLKSISCFDFCQLKDSNSIIESKISEYKSIKNYSEIEHFKNCFKRTDKALSIIKSMIDSQEIYSEKDYYDALVKSFYKNGALSLSFNPIVAAGTNSSIIHYSKSNEDVLVKDGDFLLVDCGAYYEGGYATDITRTFVKGKPADEQANVYTTVLKAFISAYCSSKYTNNTLWFDIDCNARNIVSNSELKDYTFNHGTGHGVGIGVHEFPPSVSSSELAKVQIKKNTVFTIEPGMYKPGVGGVRLENTVYIKETEPNVIIESLSKFPFENKLINYEMLSKEEQNWLADWQKED